MALPALLNALNHTMIAPVCYAKTECNKRILHKDILHEGVKGAGVADQLVQEADNVTEFGTVAPLLLPAVKHQLVKRSWAAHGSWKPVALFNGQYNLQKYRHLYGYQAFNAERTVWHWQLGARDDKLSMAQPPSLHALLGLHSWNQDWQGCDQRRQEIFCRHMKHSGNFFRVTGHPLKQLRKQEGNKEFTNTTIIFYFRGPQTYLVWPLHPTMLWYLHFDTVFVCSNNPILSSTTNTHCGTWQYTWYSHVSADSWSMINSGNAPHTKLQQCYFTVSLRNLDVWDVCD